jgi:hypothetical protein
MKNPMQRHQDMLRRQEEMRRQQEMLRTQQARLQQFQQQQRDQLSRQQQMGAWQAEQDRKKKLVRRYREVDIARSHAAHKGTFASISQPANSVEDKPSCLGRLARGIVYLIVLALLAAAAFVAYSILIEGSW